MFKPFFKQIGIDGDKKVAITSAAVEETKQTGINLHQLGVLKSSVKADFLCIEFCASETSVSIIPSEYLARHKHRLYVVKQVFSKNDELAKTYKVCKAPELIVLKLKSNQDQWTTGVNSLLMILNSIEAQEQEEIMALKQKDEERKLKKIQALEEAFLQVQKDKELAA
jgi:hypothetical protein